MKYKLVPEEKVGGLFRLKALKDFDYIKAGDLGGLVSGEHNLSQKGDCWVFGEAQVTGNAQVYGDARVSGTARVFGNARVSGNAWVFGNARVYENAQVTKCLFVQQPRHSITATNTLVFVGCEGHTWGYWDLNITEIGRKHNYSDAEIEQTKALLKVLREQLRVEGQP